MTGDAAATAPEHERWARAALTRIAEPGDVRLARLVQGRGAATVLEDLRDGRLGSLQGAPSPRRVAGYQARAEVVDGAAEVQRAGLAGIRLVCPGEPEWPGQLDDLTLAGNGTTEADTLVAPYALWVRGEHDLRLAALRSVGVIGARAATSYGEHVATEIAALLADRGWTVVSGAAFGVDAAAHRGALGAGGPTIAVMACGVDQVYPRGHDLLVQRIADSGVVVSELAPGATVTRSRLLQRNRLVAALTRGTVVVEAAVRSGTSTTARHAERLGRVVMAVPGPVTSPASVGCHELIRQARAVLVTDATDVLDAVGLIGGDLAPRRRAPAHPEDALDADTLRVLDALPARRAVGLARLAGAAAVDLSDARGALALLLDLDLAERWEAGYRLSAALRGRRRQAGPAPGPVAGAGPAGEAVGGAVPVPVPDATEGTAREAVDGAVPGPVPDATEGTARETVDGAVP